MNARPRSPDEVRARIAAHPFGETVEGMRQAFAALFAPVPPADGALAIGGVECLVIGDGHPTLVWLHGGGYVFGRPEESIAAARCIAARSHGRVLLPRYRLAPEHRWPAQLDDALAVVDALDGPLALGGESAGGHLALRVALARPGRLTRLALASPNTDRTDVPVTALRHAADDLMNDPLTDARLARMAFGSRPLDDLDVSPARGDLAALPPLHLEVGGAEVLLEQSLLLAGRAAVAGGEVALHVSAGAFHLFHLWPEALPEGARALTRLGASLAA